MLIYIFPFPFSLIFFPSWSRAGRSLDEIHMDQSIIIAQNQENSLEAPASRGHISAVLLIAEVVLAFLNKVWLNKEIVKSYLKAECYI